MDRVAEAAAEPEARAARRVARLASDSPMS
jgi:hypothetical protein